MTDAEEAELVHGVLGAFDLDPFLTLDVRARRKMQPPSRLVTELWDLEWRIEDARAEDTDAADHDAIAMIGAQHALLWVMGWLEPDEFPLNPAARWCPPPESVGYAEFMRRTTDGAKSERQLAGLACIFCGATAATMVPVAGLSSETSAQLFACADACLPEVVA